jgi:hypothetical protein
VKKAPAPSAPQGARSLEDLRALVRDLVLKDPRKAAIVLTEWIRASERQRKTG